ncbi:MAG TPA: alpha/beta hydrolase, partial [Sphingomonas sp.]|nr:alpha/beta hydrolase [Sphingomonas sp.]
QDRLAMMLDAGFPRVGSIPAAEIRAMMRMGVMAPITEVRQVRDLVIPHEGGSIPARLYQATDAPAGVIVYFHGGGWVLGDLDTADEALRILATTTDCTIISVDYRLAPEHPFPAAVDDAFTALVWAAGQRVAWTGRADAPLIVMGDSAGGNLSTVVALLARDAGGPDIALQILVYPAIDGDVDSPAMHAFESPFLTRDEIAWFYDQYIPAGQRGDPRFAPGRAGDFANLPPAVILTAEYDLLAEEARCYGEKLQRAGVEVTHLHYDGAIHAFFTMAPLLDIGRKALRDVAGCISRVTDSA